MREIKFRAWDKEDKKMYVVAHISNLLTVGTYVTVRKNEPDAITKIERDLEEDTYELMQYTGLKDKNGKEIYEGDIVKRYDQNGIIKFNFLVEQDGAVVDVPNFGFNMHNDDENESLYGELEVIGNIYENPELLVKPKEEEE